MNTRELCVILLSPPYTLPLNKEKKKPKEKGKLLREGKEPSEPSSSGGCSGGGTIAAVVVSADAGHST